MATLAASDVVEQKNDPLDHSAARFKPGIYRHYKGGLYTALGLILHHENRLPMVKYVSHTYGGENGRPLVGWPGDPDGWTDMVEVNGEKVPRFAYVGEPSDVPLTDRSEV